LVNAIRRLFDHPIGAWGLLLVYAALIFRVSAQPIGDEIELFPQADKLLHLIEYGLFGVLAYRAVRATKRDNGTRIKLFIAIGLGVAYGASDELHQYFVPTRQPSYADFVVDVIGVTAGAWFTAKQRQNLGVLTKDQR